MNRKKYLKSLFKLHQLIEVPFEKIKTVSSEQLQFVNNSIEENTYLEACPGSGKTEVIAMKVAVNLAKRRFSNSGLAVITFTNSAAKELNSRVVEYAGINANVYPNVIATFDSWLHNFIFQPYAHYLTGYNGVDGDKSYRIIDSDYSAQFLLQYQTMVNINRQTRPVSVINYYFKGKQIFGEDEATETLLASISNGDLANLYENKKKFIKAGFATYSDAERLAMKILEKYPEILKKLAKRFPFIIIDECQDLSINQINILELLRGAGSKLHFVGDLNQSIYEFRKVNPLDTVRYVDQHGFKKLHLSINFRSNQKIVDICEKIIGNRKKIKGVRQEICNPSCILWEYDEDNYNQLPSRFLKLLKENDILIQNSGILARGKSTLTEIRSQNEIYGKSNTELIALSLSLYNTANKTGQHLQHALLYLGKAICSLIFDGRGNSKNQYCPYGFNEIKWRVFLNSFLKELSEVYPFSLNEVSSTWSQWTQCLKRTLKEKWAKIPNNEKLWEDVKNRLRAPNGKATNHVNEIENVSFVEHDIRTTTIHSVKGETLDAILLLSHKDKKSKGGHYSHWLREGNFEDEHIRFAYVALSRPRHLIVLAIKSPTKAEIKKIEDLGFVHQP
jgi:DNA helicase II / ATP-dependent DNA helicase PcrA